MSTTTNAAFLIEFFQKNRMSLVLHGHMHQNAIQEISNTPFKQAGAASTITVLACPSFTGGTDSAGFKGIVNLSLDLQAGTIQIDATSVPATAKDWVTPVQVTRPLVSASRITPAENRLYFAMKKYLKQQFKLATTTAQRAEIQRFERYVDENMKEHGYVPICGKDGQRLAFLAPERYTRYYLLLLLREGFESSILLNRHLPLRPVSYTHLDVYKRQVIDFVCAEFGVSRTAARNAIDQLWAQQQSEASPIAGAESALKALTESGLRLAIISNIWHPYLVAAQRSLGDFIDRFIPPEMRFYSYREGVAKPSEVIFRRALAAAKASPDEAIMIGDSYREDIEPAANLGLNTIWILHRPAKEALNVVRIMNGCAPCPTWTLSSIADLSLALLGAGASAIVGNQLVRRNQ